MRAASVGDVSAMKRELMAGAKVDAQDSSGFTALMCDVVSARLRHIEVIPDMPCPEEDILLRGEGKEGNVRQRDAPVPYSTAALGYS
jgi:hypothetical protein